ncbi:hypothetical protein ACFQ6Q_37330, partial [Streptomyces sp. NPDC056437]|uniref:hypothetical protein n=1 Tax=Streptomyces sp. NPDC056437 TaxID=3345816 RepID=UPI00369B88F3
MNRLLVLHHRWEALGPDPLPAAINPLNRLRTELDAVAVLDTELNRRYLADSGHHGTDPVPREEAAFRRHLFSTLKTGRRTPADVVDASSDLHDNETAVVLDQTHAFAIAAALGHRRSVAAFRQNHLAFNTPWADARARMPQLIVGLTAAKNSTAEARIVERAGQVDSGLARASEEADQQRLSHLNT